MALLFEEQSQIARDEFVSLEQVDADLAKAIEDGTATFQSQQQKSA